MTKMQITDINNILNPDYIDKLENKFKLEYIFNSENLDLNFYDKILDSNILINLLNILKNHYSYYFLTIISIYKDNIEAYEMINKKSLLTYDEYINIMNLCILNKINKYIDLIDQSVDFKKVNKMNFYLEGCSYNNLHVISKYYSDDFFKYNNFIGIKLVCEKETNLEILKYFFDNNSSNALIDQNLLNECFEISCIYGNYESVKFISEHINFDIKLIKLNELKKRIDFQLNLNLYDNSKILKIKENENTCINEISNQNILNNYNIIFQLFFI